MQVIFLQWHASNKSGFHVRKCKTTVRSVFGVPGLLTHNGVRGILRRSLQAQKAWLRAQVGPGGGINGRLILT